LIANTVGFAIGFGAFVVAFVVLAVMVVRFAARVGRRRIEGPKSDSPKSDGSPGDQKIDPRTEKRRDRG
jgi:hypothetical protein